MRPHLVRPPDEGAVPVSEMSWRDKYLPSDRGWAILAIALGAAYRGWYYIVAENAVGLAFFAGIAPQALLGALWIAFGAWLITSTVLRRFTAVLVATVATNVVWGGAYFIADPFVEADLAVSGVNYIVMAVMARTILKMLDPPARRR